MKRILSILLCALMVVAIIPMSVFMVSAATTTDTIGDKDLAAGETFEKVLNLSDIDTTQTVVLTFNVTQATKADGAAADGAILKINGSRTLRVTGGGGMHIWNESTGAADGIQWNNMNAAQDVTVTVDFVNDTVNFVYNNRNVTLTDVIDLTGDTLTFRFGGADTPALTLKNIAIEYTPVAAETPDESAEDTTERESVSYFYSSFNISGRWEAQGGLFAVPNVGATSTAVSNGNTYMVVPTTAGSDTSAYGFGKSSVAFPANSVLSIDFMLDTLPGEGEIFKFLKDRASYNNHIAVCGTANGTAYLYPNMGGAQSEKFYIEAGVWYTVQIFFGANEGDVLNAPVYAKKTTDSSFTYIGSTHSKVVGAQMNYDFVIEGSTLQYNVDNIRVDTRVDDIAVKVTGYQKTNVADGKYNVRFTAAIPELYAGQENVGFEIEAPDQSKSWDKSTTTVYNSLTANFGTETVNASDLGAKYVTAMAITGIPADLGTVELVVKPYVTINGVKFYGSAVTVTVNPVTE